MGIHLMPPLYKMVITPPEVGEEHEDIFEPDPDPGVTSSDGHIRYVDGAGLLWSAIHDAISGTHLFTGYSYLHAKVSEDGLPDKYDDIGRIFLQFDTSSIPPAASIISASLGTYGLATQTYSVTPSIGLYTSNPDSATILVLSDYSKVGTTLLAPFISFNDLPYGIGDWVTFTLNAAGRANITKGGISKFSIRVSFDALDSPPAWEGYKDAAWNCDSIEGAFSPYLKVKYRV